MGKYSYFLFENFDADALSDHPANPRRFLGAGSDPILDYISAYPAGQCPWQNCAARFDTELLQCMLDGGILRREGEAVYFDCPIFLPTDAPVLHSAVRARAEALTDLLEPLLPALRDLAAQLNNSASVSENLYHILCGMVFDGAFFDALHEVVADGRMQPSGLDYLAVIYRRDPALDTLSDGLLCSYNRYTDGCCALQSFGDAMGQRHDLYRVTRRLEVHDPAVEPLRPLFEGLDKAHILTEAASLVQNGRCDPAVLRLLEHFGYTREGRICVPVYASEHEGIIHAITQQVIDALTAPMAQALTELGHTLQIAAVAHGVDSREIANELYHILFGGINETLVTRGHVAAPPERPGEGRYLQCIQLF